MKNRVAIAASVVEQAKARALTYPDNVIHLGEVAGSKAVGPLHSRVDQTPDPETGAPRLRVIIPGTKEPEVYDLSTLLVQPQLALLLAEGFRHRAATVVTLSRRTSLYHLTKFAIFLARLPPLTLVEIDEVFWTAALRWLNARNEEGQPLAVNTRARTLGMVQICIEALLHHPVHAASARDLLYRSGFPKNPWPGRSRKSIPTTVLTPSEKDSIVLACLREVAAIDRRLRNNESVLISARERLTRTLSSGQRPDFRNDIGLCAAAIDEYFSDRLASLRDLKALDPRLMSAVQYKHGMLAIRQLLYAMFQDLVPFVLLLGFRTAFNADTLLKLRWSNILTSFDSRLITILGQKRRASGAQVSTNEASDCLRNLSVPVFQAEPGIPGGLADLLDTLRRLTSRTGDILENRDHADCLFVGVPYIAGSVAKAFEEEASCDGAWKDALKKFVAANSLKPFTLRVLRSTEGEEEYRSTGGDLKAVQHRLGHRTVQTTRTFYTSDWMRRGGQDRIAETQELYIRWTESEGCADPRGKVDYTQGATTPGFMCLDPYDSPRSGQRKGKLCAAYGECPACPLSAARPRDPQAVAFYLALRRAIYEGQQGRTSGQSWHAKWAPVLEDLNRLLSLVPSEVEAAAAQYRIVLKGVG